MHVKETSTDLELFIDRSKDPVYIIPKDRFLETLKIGDKLISDWIHQLLGKTWMEHDPLYEIAKIIVRENPNNKIDWHLTFFMVEKKFYLDKVRTEKTEEKAKRGEGGSLSLGEFIDIGQEETNEETTAEIKKIVEEKIKKYGIVK